MGYLNTPFFGSHEKGFVISFYLRKSKTREFSCWRILCLLSVSLSISRKSPTNHDDLLTPSLLRHSGAPLDIFISDFTLYVCSVFKGAENKSTSQKNEVTDQRRGLALCLNSWNQEDKKWNPCGRAVSFGIQAPCRVPRWWICAWAAHTAQEPCCQTIASFMGKLEHRSSWALQALSGGHRLLRSAVPLTRPPSPGPVLREEAGSFHWCLVLTGYAEAGRESSPVPGCWSLAIVGRRESWTTWEWKPCVAHRLLWWLTHRSKVASPLVEFLEFVLIYLGI